ncbi:hypothetical protein NKG94_16140 [Micromonospora sp. M12]
MLGAALAGHAPVQERMLLTLRASRPLQVPPKLRTLLRYGRGPDPVPPSPAEHARPGGVGCPAGPERPQRRRLRKLGRDRQTSVAVYLSGRLFATYSADGVMVASPTGSTAYSFAAGGPVLSPRLNALVFTPVAPHMAFNRSMVTAPDEPVGVQCFRDRVRSPSSSTDEYTESSTPATGSPSTPPDAARSSSSPTSTTSSADSETSSPGRRARRPSRHRQPAPLLVYRPDLPVPEDLRHLHLPANESDSA